MHFIVKLKLKVNQGASVQVLKDFDLRENSHQKGLHRVIASSDLSLERVTNLRVSPSNVVVTTLRQPGHRVEAAADD